MADGGSIFSQSQRAEVFLANHRDVLGAVCSFMFFFLPRWTCGKGVLLESGRREFDSRFLRVSFFRGRVIPVTVKIGTPVPTLPGAWRNRVSAGTGWPAVSIP